MRAIGKGLYYVGSAILFAILMVWNLAVMILSAITFLCALGLLYTIAVYLLS